MPPHFTGAQLDTLMRTASPLAPADRPRFMEDVARALDGREIGDGLLHRVAVECQRRYWSPPLATHRPAASTPAERRAGRLTPRACRDHGADRAADGASVARFGLGQPVQPDQKIQLLTPELDLVDRPPRAPTLSKAVVTVARGVVGAFQHRGRTVPCCPIGIRLVRYDPGIREFEVFASRAVVPVRFCASILFFR